MLKTIFFDLDGLILDSETIYFKYWLEARDTLRYNLSENVILSLRSCDKKIAQKIITEETGDPNAYSSIRNKRKELMDTYLKNNVFGIKPGVKEFLERIKSSIEADRVIVTSSFSRKKRESLEKHGVLEYFNLVITSKDVKNGKPYPDIYNYACKKTKTKKEECLAYEDSPNGVLSAYQAGIKVIMVPDLTMPEEKLLDKCRVFENIIDSLSFLKNFY